MPYCLLFPMISVTDLDVFLSSYWDEPSQTEWMAEESPASSTVQRTQQVAVGLLGPFARVLTTLLTPEN